jgi:hypothetical protein
MSVDEVDSAWSCFLGIRTFERLEVKDGFTTLLRTSSPSIVFRTILALRRDSVIVSGLTSSAYFSRSVS